MINKGIVQGSAEQAKPLIIGVDTIYVHTDIQLLGDGLYQYNEIQYDKDEYIRLMAEKDAELEHQSNSTLIGLADAYEQLLKSEEENTSAQVALADVYELVLELKAEIAALKSNA